jgi:hypothetical protein
MAVIFSGSPLLLFLSLSPVTEAPFLFEKRQWASVSEDVLQGHDYCFSLVTGGC